MAIIRSAAVGTARGSLGIITYRSVRGRTIGSQKRGGVDPATRAAGHTLHQFIFGLMARYASLRSEDIEVSFTETKYGSPRNAFMKCNYEGFKAALTPLFSAGMSVDDITQSELDTAIHEYAANNPEAIYRAKVQGQFPVYLTGDWAASGSFGSIKSASIDGTSVADGVTLYSLKLAAGDEVNVTLQGFDSVTLDASDPMVIEYQSASGGDSVTVKCSGASVQADGSNFVVSGTLAEAIPVGNYSSMRFVVRHEEGVNGMSARSYKNIKVVQGDGAGTGSNPL